MQEGEETTWHGLPTVALILPRSKGGRSGHGPIFEPNYESRVPKAEPAPKVEAWLEGRTEFPYNSHPRPDK